MASTLNVKDTNRLETVRVLEDSDPAFYDVLNRPHVDIEQRTNDLDRIFTPARGLRVRQEIPASDSIEVESGVVVEDDGVTINQTSLQTIGPVTPTGAGTIRADLIYFNLDTVAAVRLAGVPVATGVGFSSGIWPDLPTLAGAIPLAIIYVGENIGTSVSFDETITGATEGRVIDIRPAIGGRPIFEDNVANILTDTASGSVGSSAKVARANHRHPLNVDGTVPATHGAGLAAAVGSAATYARRDHRHLITVESNPGVMLTDAASASAGSSAEIVRADHRHPLNVDGTSPAAVTAAAAVGTAATYARRDHVHAISDDLNKTVSYVVETVTAYSGSITLTSGTWLIEVFGRYHQAAWGNVDLVIDGTTVDSTGGFGDQDGTGYVVVYGGKEVSGAGTYNFSMTNVSTFGGPYMRARALRVGA